MVVALARMPQLSSFSVIMGNSWLACSTSVKVQPSFASTVAVVDMLIEMGRFLGIFLVEFADNLR